MNISPVASRPVVASPAGPRGPQPADRPPQEQLLRQTFESVVGQMLFGQLLKSMRKSLGKPAYFHGGRAEEVFQQQLDQVLAEKMSHASAASLVGPMFELFTLRTRQT